MPNYMTELSPDNNTHVYQIKDKEAAPIDLLKDTVGWVGKNKLQIPSSVVSKTVVGITFTVTRNADGEVTEIDANGTATTDANLDLVSNFVMSDSMILSGCPTSGSDSTFRLIAQIGSTYYKEYGNGLELSPGTIAQLYCQIKNGQTVNHLKFHPMLRDASIIDNTYEPYHESVEQCKFDRAEQRVLGARNWFYPVKSDGGATVDISENGKAIRVYSNTVATYRMAQFKMPIAPNTDYVLSFSADYTSGKGNVVVSSASSVDMKAFGNITSNVDGEMTFNSGNNKSIIVKVLCTSEVSEVGDITFNNLLLTLASDTNRSWTPYAMTNRELTERHSVVYIYNNSDIAKLQDGINAVFFSSGITLGTSMQSSEQITTPNNMRGFVTRNGNNLVGLIASFDATQTYIITSSHLNDIQVVRKLIG